MAVNWVNSLEDIRNDTSVAEAYRKFQSLSQHLKQFIHLISDNTNTELGHIFSFLNEAFQRSLKVKEYELGNLADEIPLDDKKLGMELAIEKNLYDLAENVYRAKLLIRFHSQGAQPENQILTTLNSVVTSLVSFVDTDVLPLLPQAAQDDINAIEQQEIALRLFDSGRRQEAIDLITS